MYLRFLRTANDGGGTAAPAATGADATNQSLTQPAPAGGVGAPGPGSSQPAGAPTVDPAKPGAVSGDQAGSGNSNDQPDREQQLLEASKTNKFLGQLQNENSELRKKLASLSAQPAVPPQHPVKSETQATPEATPFDGRTYRAQLLNDPDVKREYSEIEEDEGKDRAERWIRGLITQGKIAHQNQQAILARTSAIELENQTAAINREWSERHPELTTDTELASALERLEDHYNELAQTGKLGPLEMKEMLYKLAQLEYLPRIIEAKVAAGVKAGVERELAKARSGGTTAAGAAPGGQPGGNPNNQDWKKVLGY